MTGHTDLYDVAIVGYGPTGMVAASLLARLNHRVIVCERWPSLYGLPRLTHIDDETARILQAACDVDVALRDSSPTEYHWVNASGDELLFIPAQTDGPMGYPEHISMYQPDIEDALDQRIRSYGTVEHRQGWAVTDLAQDASGVELVLRPWMGEGGVGDHDSQRVRASYVIAADGSKSQVRSVLGVSRDDLGFNERWVNVDTEWLGPMPSEFATCRQYCDPARGHMTMSIGHQRQRFEFAVLDDEESEQMQRPEVAWDWLRATHDLGPEDLRLVRQIVYVFEARIARSWRVGRVLLAGDAAHTMPPYLGQGACSGIRDAANLAWKLDLVLSGKADDDLLDTYQEERQPHVTAVTQMAMGLGHIANMHDPEQAAERDAFMLSGQAPPPPQMPPLLAGVIASTPDGPEPMAGALTPQRRLALDGEQGLLDDLLGFGFALVARDDPRGALSDTDAALLKHIGCRVVHFGTGGAVDVDGAFLPFMDTYGAEAYIARPDFTAFGMVQSLAQLGLLIDRLRSALALQPEAVTLP
ncbi:MAG TPA: bifunctional 3-(3-hydroxy-phenyl)propionate/3-hydroxycinnamic acid hydroxylase [Baekduia sp.]|nr:bifunctional 3-(3-hydroxy-phenyl)propionate/3-hydroxycinnamic acid hydroxylase [Baekduia sp.]